MSAEADALRELAQNRSCKLVASRVRTPGKGDHGKFGLKDAKTGREVFGFGKTGLTATPEEIERFLRGDAASAWKSSVGRTKAKPRAKPAPPPKPEPKLSVREARPKDAEAIAPLIVALGYEVSAAEVKRRLAALKKAGALALVAERGGIAGVLTTYVTLVLHRPRPVGRITMMVVADGLRGQGIGTALVAEAEKGLAARGCGLIEVTSNVKRLRAHAFYERLGYERTSYRFAKTLQD
ncbi:MAG TPA: GNAT family N-acetyltransferase [Allosphingosinicella sp.]|nr:GNAT family N-acetyltransferase [Allosphingosinicella sp.]